MAIPSSLTLSYDAQLSTTLFNYRKILEDHVSLANALLYKIMKGEGYKEITDLGDRYGVPLMYGVGGFDSYSGYDQLDVSPTDGITMAFYDYAQCAAPIVISGLEEKKNAGSKSKLIDLLEAKTKQADIGIKEGFGKALLQGNGANSATAITTAFTSATNGSTFIEPLPKLIAYDPTASVSVGNINQSTYSWWRNQYAASSASTYAGFLKELRNMYNKCSQWGQKPDLHLVDQNVFELYEAALAAAHRNPSYQKADIPFDNILFKGKPVTWDALVPDVANGTITSIPVAASGTWYMLNTEYWGVRVHKGTNFTPTPFVRPENQDAKVAQILWLGLVYVSNRRCQGVIGSIDTTLTS